ncbi:MAG TPA: hypothetical protein VM888_01205 [Chitinophagaceae bacterium]|jgi:hypothetical protein|nr:hypothetical protein [Chitinophagaceae bacterium]
MEALFTADFILNGNNKSYQVFFENDEYVFHSSEDASKTFSLKREDDIWKPSGINDAIATEQAIHALEQYLLSQH